MPDRTVTGTSVWEQIVAQRKALLDAFDKGKAHAKGHAVQTYHGKVAEAEFRRWLSEFLPKRFGVTSGYVVAQDRQPTAVYPHFDVILYDKLDAPVLWVEGHSDVSEDGKSRAIPVEYIRAVLEVKSSYGSTEAKAAMEHLCALKPFATGYDLPNERYKKFLPPSFFCGVVFFDTDATNEKSKAALEHLNPSKAPRDFFGGIILRGEGQREDASCKLLIADHPDLDPPGPRVFRCWSPAFFPEFAFDVVALLNGTYTPLCSSSTHSRPWPLILASMAPEVRDQIDK